MNDRKRSSQDTPDPEGRRVSALVAVDGASFREAWLSAVGAAERH